ncbi:T9SS type A sorting domain-containing protein [Saccharicrinis fermentans]|uniref:Secretion system C-terminal sorting domain-containing protein n=1 Tax=Saccharicrinis fermentans DSM 9555 = JCM 21142 TaxID=869213 RepID=W7YP12_9BACT|nr:T9SS type A sorting domain-containing protein [Saccharicrinis fermentans]GAF04149.1 hypothetical protein JCM21142_72845 [Saccharicrinis fermentans DSM 9555 = JCM 21142]
MSPSIPTIALPSGTAGLTIDSNNDFNLCQGNDDDYDVYLNGKLTLVDGSLNIGNSSNNRNNDIEYSGGGLSEIDVQGGNLYVNGQIRRNPASSAGILKYSQSGGDVTINGRSALASNAKLEILNVGSEFNMTDGTLTIMRGGGTSYGDLYLRPEKYNVTGGEIIFDNSGVGAQNYLLDANISLNDLTIDGSGDDASVKLMLSPLILDGDLTLANAYSILDANATYNVALTVNGDFENSGVYNYYENTTTLNGVTQYITGSSDIEFYDLVIDPLTKVALSKDITVYHDLNLNSGTLDVGAHSIYVKGDVINNATYSSTGNGLVLDGSVSQEISGTGTFARLELKNTSGATTANDISLQGELALTKGVLNIGSYSLSLGETASISGIFSENTMITTNGVYSNKGVQKVMPAGSSSFTFPVGVSGKYTPAVLNFTASSNVSTVKVHPVNSKHPANIDDANVLEYYWAVESVGLVGASGSLVLNYKDEDVQGDDANYYAERLLVPGTAWSESNSVDETANQITFTLSGDDISGEYTAGLDAAFPDNIPQYTSTMNGDWSDPTSWTQTGGDAYTLSGAPNGFIVYIQHDITLDENFVQANKVIIESEGTLKIDNTTYGHILNNVSGSGTIYLEDGQLPEGNFDEFLSCSNTSTLEFGGSGDYGIIADLFNNAANLVFSGTGSRILPNADLTVCKQLLIDGPVLDNSLYNRALYINGSFERVAGSFISGSGSSAIVSFIGSTEQNLGGFSGADNMLNNLEIDNSAGLRLNDDVEVAGTLILTNGVIHTSSENSLTLTNTVGVGVTPSAGTANSYVNGPLRKWMNQSDSFTFPIGSDGELGNKLTITAVRTGTKLWTAEYKRPNGTYEDYAFPLTAINAHEYWNLSTPGGGEAKIQLGWDSGSDITPVMTEHGLTDIRVVNYDASSWQEIASSASGADAAGIVITNSRVYVNESGSDFTTATVNTNKPKVRFNPDEAVCDLSTGIKVEMTSTVPTAADYELSYTINNGATQTVTVSSFPYYLPTPTIGVYALTGFKYDNKVREGVVDVTEFEVFETPTAALAGDDQSHQGLSQTTLEANTPVVGYGQWSIVSGTGGSLVDPTDPMTVFNGTNGSSYLLRWTITNGDCQSVDEVAIAFPILPPHQWQGAISDDWFTAGNWTDGVVPDGVADITIANAGNEPVIRSGAIAYVNNLTIEADASLTLEPGARMTINGDLITNDQLTVKNTVDAPVSLIVNGTVSGESNYEWDGMTKLGWWYIAHPVSGVTESDYDNSYGVGRYAMNRYSKDSWFRVAGYVSSDDIYDFSSDPDPDAQLEGYDLYPAEDVPLKYAGVLNNEDYSRTYTKAQWWLVANPYPSYIDVEDAGFDMGNFRKTVYIRKSDNSVSAYNVLNGVGINEGSRYISPGQSVWMRTHSATDYVNISTTTRVHETGGYGLKSGSEEGNDRVRLQLQSDYGTDETVVIFNENGSEFFTAYDSEKLFNSGNIANIYSNKDGKEIAINSLPELESGMVIPLSYKVEEDGLSDFTIRATNLNSFIPEVDVYLEDKVEGLSVNLRETPEYTFMPLTTSASDRFELRFVESVSTGIESAEAEILQSNVTIYAVNQKAYVKVSEELLMANDRVIEVYNLSGQLKAQHELNSTKTVFDLPDSKTMYIIKVSIDQSSYQEKVIAF